MIQYSRPSKRYDLLLSDEIKWINQFEKTRCQESFEVARFAYWATEWCLLLFVVGAFEAFFVLSLDIGVE